jgi:hypothetical protein
MFCVRFRVVCMWVCRIICGWSGILLLVGSSACSRGCGRQQAGVAFEPATVEASIQRDYDQTVKLGLRNNSDKNVVVAAKALGQFDDLPADIVGPGSVDEPVQVPPGGRLELRLAITAPDATREAYDIPVEAAGASATARVRITKIDFRLSFRIISEDPHTLAKTIEVRNDGSTLADLALHIAAPNESEVRLEPSAKHAYLPAGKTLQLVAAPVLYLEFQSLKAVLEGRAGGQSARFSLDFQAPADKRLIGVRTATKEYSSASDWYCTNKPDTCTEVPGPQGNGLSGQNGGPSLASVGSVFFPSPGICGLKPPTGKEDDCPPICRDPQPCTGVGWGGTGKKGFHSEEEAAIDALKTINPISVCNSREYSGLIIHDPETDTWYWTVECEGDSDCVAASDCKPRFECTGAWHTHGSPSPGAEGFSRKDLEDNGWTHKEYVATPTGKILVYPIVKDGKPKTTPGYGPASESKETAPAPKKCPKKCS